MPGLPEPSSFRIVDPDSVVLDAVYRFCDRRLLFLSHLKDLLSAVLADREGLSEASEKEKTPAEKPAQRYRIPLLKPCELTTIPRLPSPSALTTDLIVIDKAYKKNKKSEINHENKLIICFFTIEVQFLKPSFKMQ